MLRGQIWLYQADPSVGDEIGKTRPCIIVSNIGLRAKHDRNKFLVLTDKLFAVMLRPYN